MIDVTYDDRAVRQALRDLARAGRNLRPAMREVAGALESAIKDAFKKEQTPGGDPWAALSETTKAIRGKRGKWPGQILDESGGRGLVGSISSSHDARSAVAGAGKKYAPTHQFGARKGAFGRTRRGSPIPWGDIPARPFLGRSTELDADILEIVREHFADALQRPR